MYPTIILVIALYASANAVYYNLLTMRSEKYTEKWSKQFSKNAQFWQIVACILWGWFYYITH